MKFAFIVALLFQLYFLLISTVFRDICIIPRSFFSPSVSTEHLEWFMNEYEPVLHGETQFVMLGTCINYLVCGLLIGKLLSLFFAEDCGEDRIRIGKKWTLGVLIFGGAICAGYCVFNSIRGLPYQFYRDSIVPEVLSIMVMILYKRRSLSYRKGV